MSSYLQIRTVSTFLAVEGLPSSERGCTGVQGRKRVDVGSCAGRQRAYTRPVEASED